jgi:hypothetical protein
VLRDRLAGYATRVVLLEGGSRRPGDAAEVGLALSGPAVDAAAAPDPDPPQTRAGRNMLFNSGFEQAALPGWPDSWWFGHPAPNRMCGDPGGPGQDAAAWHGDWSLRIVNPLDRPSGFATATYRHAFASTGLRGGIPVERGRPYTFSAYLRAEKDGTPAEIVVCNYVMNSLRYEEGVTRRLALTPEWMRYEVTVTHPPAAWAKGHRPEFGIVLRNLGADTSIWIDAAQFEPGDRATAYAP